MDQSVLKHDAATVAPKHGAGALQLLARFLSCKSGATAIEYAVMIAGLALVIASTVFALGGTTLGLYDSVQAAFDLVMN